jgi:hypothetical protein
MLLCRRGPTGCIVLPTNASVELATMLGKQVALAVSLADGTRTQFHCEITQHVPGQYAYTNAAQAQRKIELSVIMCSSESESFPK